MTRNRHIPPLLPPAKTLSRPLAGRVLLLAVLLLGHALPLQAGEEPQVLTVRLEKIEAIQGKRRKTPDECIIK